MNDDGCDGDDYDELVIVNDLPDVDDGWMDGWMDEYNDDDDDDDDDVDNDNDFDDDLPDEVTHLVALASHLFPARDVWKHLDQRVEEGRDEILNKFYQLLQRQQ